MKHITFVILSILLLGLLFISACGFHHRGPYHRGGRHLVSIDPGLHLTSPYQNYCRR